MNLSIEDRRSVSKFKEDLQADSTAKIYSGSTESLIKNHLGGLFGNIEFGGSLNIGEIKKQFTAKGVTVPVNNTQDAFRAIGAKSNRPTSKIESLLKSQECVKTLVAKTSSNAEVADAGDLVNESEQVANEEGLDPNYLRKTVGTSSNTSFKLMNYIR
jgi:hypothetical protein